MLQEDDKRREREEHFAAIDELRQVKLARILGNFKCVSCPIVSLRTQFRTWENDNCNTWPSFGKDNSNTQNNLLCCTRYMPQ